MADLGVVALWCMVSDQQAQINCLRKLCNHIVQWNFALRDEHECLCTEHHALCYSLRLSGLLSEHAMANAKVKVTARSLASLLVDSEILVVLLPYLGHRAGSLLASTNRQCLKHFATALAELAGEDSVEDACSILGGLQRDQAPTSLVSYMQSRMPFWESDLYLEPGAVRPEGVTLGSRGRPSCWPAWHARSPWEQPADMTSPAASKGYPESNDGSFGATGSSTGSRARCQAAPERATTASRSGSGSAMGLLFQLLWQDPALAGNLSCTMGITSMERFRVVSRAGRECFRDIHGRLVVAFRGLLDTEPAWVASRRDLQPQQGPSTSTAQLRAPLEPSATLRPAVVQEVQEARQARLSTPGKNESEPKSSLLVWRRGRHKPEVLRPPREAEEQAATQPPEEDGADGKAKIFRRNQVVLVSGLRSAEHKKLEGRLIREQAFSGQWSVRILQSGEVVQVSPQQLWPLPANRTPKETAGRRPPGTAAEALEEDAPSPSPASAMDALLVSTRESEKEGEDEEDEEAEEEEEEEEEELFEEPSGLRALETPPAPPPRRQAARTAPAAQPPAPRLRQQRPPTKPPVPGWPEEEEEASAPALLACIADIAGMGEGGRSSRLLRCLGLPTARALEAANRGLARAVARRTQSLYVIGGAWSLIGCQKAALRSAEVLPPGGDKWEAIPDLVARRFSSCVAVLKGCIYVCGGSAGHSPLRYVEMYNPAVGYWQDLPWMLQQRSSAMAAALHGRIFVCGGLGHRDAELKSGETFDPAEMCWKPVKPLKNARYMAASLVAGGKFYVIGGQGASNVLTACERFDGDKWEQLPHLNKERWSCSAGLLRGCIYVVGGNDGKVALRSAEHLTVTSPRGTPQHVVKMRWELLPQLQQARYGASLVAVPALGQLLVCGGHDGSRAISGVETFEPEAKTPWRRGPPMSASHTEAVMGLVAGEIHICAGHDGSQALGTSESFDPVARGAWKERMMENAPPDDSELMRGAVRGRVGALSAVVARL